MKPAAHQTSDVNKLAAAQPSDSASVLAVVQLDGNADQSQHGTTKMTVRMVRASISGLVCDAGAANAIALSAREFAFWWGCRTAAHCAGSACRRSVVGLPVECAMCKCAQFCGSACAETGHDVGVCDRLGAAAQHDPARIIDYLRAHDVALRSRLDVLPPPEMNLLVLSIDAVRPGNVLCLLGECDEDAATCKVARKRVSKAQATELARIRTIATHFASLHYGGHVVHPVYVALCNQTLGDVSAMPLSTFARLSVGANIVKSSSVTEAPMDTTDGAAASFVKAKYAQSLAIARHARAKTTTNKRRR